MAQHDKRPRTSDPGAFDAVPDADRAEQAEPAYPDDAPYTDPDPGSVSDEPALVGGGGGDQWHANPVDIAEQAIPVPLDDDYDGVYGDDEP